MHDPEAGVCQCAMCALTRERDEAVACVAFVKLNVDALAETVEAAIRSREGRGGQHVPYHGQFAAAVPSVLKDIAWWVKRLKLACDQDERAVQALAGDGP